MANNRKRLIKKVKRELEDEVLYRKNLGLAIELWNYNVKLGAFIKKNHAKAIKENNTALKIAMDELTKEFNMDWLFE